jgi:hypothetical protein
MNTYYVDSKIGKDNNEGTFEEPFKTIKDFSNIAIAGDSCYIREGVYRELLNLCILEEKTFL